MCVYWGGGGGGVQTKRQTSRPKHGERTKNLKRLKHHNNNNGYRRARETGVSRKRRKVGFVTGEKIKGKRMEKIGYSMSM